MRRLATSTLAPCCRPAPMWPDAATAHCALCTESMKASWTGLMSAALKWALPSGSAQVSP
eukprot:62570-Lingulodinium_polyedra.AAC.1